MVDKSKKDGISSAELIYQQALGLLFAGSLQVPMVSSILFQRICKDAWLTGKKMISFILYNLCKYPEYLEPLRKEANSLSATEPGVQDSYAYPLLDSFLKESARLNSLRISNTTFLALSRILVYCADRHPAAVERKVMASHIDLSGGVRVPRGNWVMAAQREIMRDPANYPEPDKFYPYRFVSMEKDSLRSKSRFTHPSNDFLFWGSVGRAWYVLSWKSLVRFSRQRIPR